jgi:hypothetical protein
MSVRRASWLAVTLCVGLTSAVDAQKGGKPKSVDQPGTAGFRCTGPTAATRTPPGTPCGPYVDGFTPDYPDAITGDGNAYVGGAGETTVGGSGAFLRSDGEFDLIVRPTNGRLVFLNFEAMVTAPLGRKNFNFAQTPEFGLNTNVIIPGTETVAGNGLLSIPIGNTWPTRLKGGFTDTYGVFYSIRFNPTTYPGSTHASVRRDTESRWTIFASDTDVARLLSPGVRNQGQVDEGSYRMPFEITFTVP